MVCRFFGGVAASGPLAICGGALAGKAMSYHLHAVLISCPPIDFWEAEKRGGAIAIFALATFGGPAVGPVVSSPS